MVLWALFFIGYRIRFLAESKICRQQKQNRQDENPEKIR
jgi:hypothetical protein